MGFQALGFPCDQFHNQQPESSGEEILNGLKYVRPGGGFVPNFQMFGLVEINGKNEHPLFTFLKKYCPPTSDTFQDDSLLLYSPLKVSDIRWNFEQFLIGKDGKPYMRFSPETDPMALKSEIQRMLQTKPEAEESEGFRNGV
ncbi:Glutathione peroxidase 6 [Mizuhopecten yessoensis]|nr:Glutathione peroxidase 6 [Mizuhopecten yessoensis]